uniref:Uncharacterized protein n=1 Tax=Myoviridae sp. ct1ba2 TaxID=2827654 RepID=A0A8S5S6X8_9CAUD|nr:MAG TPA: hypothetical protein [Myoviridae sp. ct1ba2]
MLYSSKPLRTTTICVIVCNLCVIFSCFVLPFCCLSCV